MVVTVYFHEAMIVASVVLISFVIVRAIFNIWPG
jgi:hypothetical protein